LTVRVFDDCVTALVLVGNQLIKKLTYKIGSDEPVSANFFAFSDSVTQKYMIDDPCGPIEYRIKNEQPFAVLVPPYFNSPKEGHIVI
jgi:galactose mutarotase-like enzyme